MNQENMTKVYARSDSRIQLKTAAHTMKNLRTNGQL